MRGFFMPGENMAKKPTPEQLKAQRQQAITNNHKQAVLNMLNEQIGKGYITSCLATGINATVCQVIDSLVEQLNVDRN